MSCHYMCLGPVGLLGSLVLVVGPVTPGSIKHRWCLLSPGMLQCKSAPLLVIPSAWATVCLFRCIGAGVVTRVAAGLVARVTALSVVALCH
jgi:hypothetical protein